MKMTRITLATLVAMSAALTSCSDDDNGISVPETYEFTRNGSTTVSFSGQTTRLKMVNEIGDAFADTDMTVAKFTELFVDGTGFSAESGVDQSDIAEDSRKNVNSKVGEAAADQDAVQADFVSYYTNQVNEVFPKWDEAAASGSAGVTTDSRYVSAKGLEYNQAFYKGLIGALVADQAMNDYLVAVESDDNETIGDSNYTDMEHHYDEAYGYVFGNTDDDTLMYKYLGRLDENAHYAGITQETLEAFIAGRVAIVAKDYDERDAQIAIIRKNLSLVIGVRAVYYLQAAKTYLGTDLSFHDLSEGYGFVYSLQFTHNPETGEPYFTRTEVEDYLAQLESGNGFWDVSSDTLDDISDEIAEAFGISVSEASL